MARTKILDTRLQSTDEHGAVSSDKIKSSETATAIIKVQGDQFALKNSEIADTLLKSSATGVNTLRKSADGA